MRLIVPPSDYYGRAPSVFLAGGISGCPDWQGEVARRFAEQPVVVLNPRRPHFDITDPTASAAQVRWEFEHLRRAALVLFWFPLCVRSVQPIAMYELGAHATSGTQLVVGTDPGYLRAVDVKFQLALVRPEIEVHETLEATCAAALTALGLVP